MCLVHNKHLVHVICDCNEFAVMIVTFDWFLALLKLTNHFNPVITIFMQS